MPKVTMSADKTIAMLAQQLATELRDSLPHDLLPEDFIAYDFFVNRLRYALGGTDQSFVHCFHDYGLSPAQQQMKQDLLDPMRVQVGGGHYKDMPIQHFTFCQVNRIPWGEAAAIKYICRHKKKNGVQDIDKAIHYLEMVRAAEYPDAPAAQKHTA